MWFVSGGPSVVVQWSWFRCWGHMRSDSFSDISQMLCIINPSLIFFPSASQLTNHDTHDSALGWQALVAGSCLYLVFLCCTLRTESTIFLPLIPLLFLLLLTNKARLTQLLGRELQVAQADLTGFDSLLSASRHWRGWFYFVGTFQRRYTRGIFRFVFAWQVKNSVTLQHEIRFLWIVQRFLIESNVTHISLWFGFGESHHVFFSSSLLEATWYI